MLLEAYRPQAKDTDTLSLTLEGSIAVLTVRDNGVGIAPEMFEHMFEPFRQAHQDLARQHGGLGLGLALVRGIVDLHRGTVRLESEGTGRGTVVTVQIPAQVFIRPVQVDKLSTTTRLVKSGKILE